ncbi:MAG: DUF4348 domain-containing protein [Prevotella sp.]|nr:DUF4348 domain-containing protein [Prevotella sp.]
MIRFLISWMVLILLFSACGGHSATSSADTDADSVQADTAVVDSTAIAEADEPVPLAADEFFDDFIFNFAANKRLQKARVKFPLAFVKDGETTRIQASAWKMEHFFMTQDHYTLIFDSEQEIESVKNTRLNHAVVEKIFLNQNTIRQYEFRREQGLWMMEQMREIPLSESHNASFLAFYSHFATDPDFQLKSLAETVHFVGPDPDDDFNTMEGIITPDTWPAFAPELPSDMIYNIIYGEPSKEQDTKIFLLRGIANGFEMELSFRRHHGHWRLTKLIT